VSFTEAQNSIIYVHEDVF